MHISELVQSKNGLTSLGSSLSFNREFIGLVPGFIKLIAFLNCPIASLSICSFIETASDIFLKMRF